MSRDIGRQQDLCIHIVWITTHMLLAIFSLGPPLEEVVVSVICPKNAQASKVLAVILVSIYDSPD